MRLQCGLDGNKLMEMLRSLLLKEQEEWKPIIYGHAKRNKEIAPFEIGGECRDDIAHWLLKVHLELRLGPETFNLSLAILDRFLLLVRAHPKYLHCIAISCYFLAAKCAEEDEALPLTSDLVQTSHCGCSVAEVLRMELVILAKLQWNLHGSTALEFIHVLHASLMLNLGASNSSSTICQQLAALTQKWFMCLCNHEVLAFKPSTIAVALISLELSLHTGDWLAITIVLQKLIMLGNEELIRCREIISRTLAKNSRRCRVPFMGCNFGKMDLKASKRKAEKIQVEDDIYEGIKRLYGDDVIVETMISCESQASLASNIIQPTVCAAV